MTDPEPFDCEDCGGRFDGSPAAYVPEDGNRYEKYCLDCWVAMVKKREENE